MLSPPRVKTQRLRLYEEMKIFSMLRIDDFAVLADERTKDLYHAFLSLQN